MYTDENYLKYVPSSKSGWEFGFSHYKLQQDFKNHFTRLALSSDLNEDTLSLFKPTYITKTVVAHI